MEKNHLVIIGGGFGGVVLAKQMAQNPGFRVTLVSKFSYHVFHPNLYEVATSPEELTTVEQLKKTVSLPLVEIFQGLPDMEILIGEAKEIDFDSQEIVVEGTKVKYDSLVIAAGSISEYYNVPGAKEFGLTLKSLTDALRLRSDVESVVLKASEEVTKSVLKFVIAGGGYTGVEYAAELAGFLDFLAWKHSYPREKLEIVIFDSGSEFFKGAMSRASHDASIRLKDRGVRVQLFSTVTEVGAKEIKLASGEVVNYDLLVWTAGVSACGMPTKQQLDLSMQHRIAVDSSLRIKSVIKGNAFALGDIACTLDESGRPVPCTAQDAVDQAEYLSKNLSALIQKQTVPSYSSIKHGYVVMLGGKWAIFHAGGIYLKGYLGWLVGQVAHLRYYYKLLGFWKAFKYVVLQIDIYRMND